MKDKTTKYLIIPMLVLWGTFTVFPVLASFIKSLQSCRGNTCSFVGLQNYANLLGDNLFRESLINTSIFFIVQVPIMILLSIILANVLNQKDLRFKGAYRTMVILPAVTSLVVYSIFFKLIFMENGLVNNLLLNINVLDHPIQWLSTANPARFVLIIALVWRWTGYNTVFFLSGMQNIDDEIYEAAKIDGANTIQQFTRITLPLLKPIILFVTIISTLGTLNLFDEPMVITNGGPGTATITLGQMIYKHLFVFTPNAGYASAIAYFIVIIAVTLAILQRKVLGDDE
ncbi:sugar ABC transporter permease [Mollicutes bacterium LVI A0039]|nr:sugar ABC transporter permease [Mollicutes bacterium LVI A0039]